MTRKSQLQTRVDADTKQAFDDYTERFDFTKAEVMRQIVRQHLAGEGYDIPVADGGGEIPARQLEEQLAALEEQLAEDDTPDTWVGGLLNLASITASGAIVLGVVSLVGLVPTEAAVSGGVVLLLVALVALVGAAARQL